jgi:two-component system, cell cycle sensor histidine kinase and response regulator CckA
VEPRTSMTVVLCADNDAYTLFSIWKALRAEGFTVFTAGNGPAALEISRTHLGPIDLLITSIDLPQISGLELFEAIKAERPGLKVLLMARDSRESVQASIPGLPFLQKPFTATALRESVKKSLSSTTR